MTAAEIRKKSLRKNGYDGLVYPGECGCEIDDLAPCSEMDITACQPAYRHICLPQQCEGCSLDCGGWREGNWYMSTEKPEGKEKTDAKAKP